MSQDPPNKSATPQTFVESFEEALQRLRSSSTVALRTGPATVGTAAALSASTLLGCGTDVVLPDDAAGSSGATSGDGVTGTGGMPSTTGTGGMGGGVSDSTMVRYVSQWSVMQPSSGNLELFLKLLVKPVPGADLATKRVSVTLQSYDIAHHPTGDRGDGTYSYDLEPEIKVDAFYVATQADGYEEWRVKVVSKNPDLYRGQSPLFLLRSWYEDGTGNTYYDDNQGEQHLVKCESTFWQAGCSIRKDLSQTNVTLTNTGIEGQIQAVAPKLLDPDDQIVVTWTTDSWATVNETPMVWVSNESTGLVRYRADMNIPGNFTVLQYSLAYRHGTVNGAKTYTLWDDNNGAGYIVLK